MKIYYKIRKEYFIFIQRKKKENLDNPCTIFPDDWLDRKNESVKWKEIFSLFSLKNLFSDNLNCP